MSSPSKWKQDDFAGDLPEVHGLLAEHEDKQKDPVPASKRYLDGDVFSNEFLETFLSIFSSSQEHRSSASPETIDAAAKIEPNRCGLSLNPPQFEQPAVASASASVAALEGSDDHGREPTPPPQLKDEQDTSPCEFEASQSGPDTEALLLGLDQPNVSTTPICDDASQSENGILTPLVGFDQLTPTKSYSQDTSQLGVKGHEVSMVGFDQRASTSCNSEAFRSESEAEGLTFDQFDRSDTTTAAFQLGSDVTTPALGFDSPAATAPAFQSDCDVVMPAGFDQTDMTSARDSEDSRSEGSDVRTFAIEHEQHGNTSTAFQPGYDLANPALRFNQSNAETPLLDYSGQSQSATSLPTSEFTFRPPSHEAIPAWPPMIQMAMSSHKQAGPLPFLSQGTPYPRSFNSHSPYPNFYNNVTSHHPPSNSQARFPQNSYAVFPPGQFPYPTHAQVAALVPQAPLALAAPFEPRLQSHSQVGQPQRYSQTDRFTTNRGQYIYNPGTYPPSFNHSVRPKHMGVYPNDTIDGHPIYDRGHGLQRPALALPSFNYNDPRYHQDPVHPNATAHPTGQARTAAMPSMGLGNLNLTQLTSTMKFQLHPMTGARAIEFASPSTTIRPLKRQLSLNKEARLTDLAAQHSSINPELLKPVPVHAPGSFFRCEWDNCGVRIGGTRGAVNQHLKDCHDVRPNTDGSIRCLFPKCGTRGAPAIKNTMQLQNLAKHITDKHFESTKVMCGLCHVEQSRKDSIRRHLANSCKKLRQLIEEKEGRAPSSSKKRRVE